MHVFWLAPRCRVWALWSLSFAFPLTFLLLPRDGQAADVPGMRATLAGSAVVNFGELARRQALQRGTLPPVRPRLLPEFDDEGGEPGAIPGEPIARGPAASPFAPQAPLLASPSPSQAFIGLDDIPMVDSSYIIIPPDVDGAVGRTRILQGLNNNYRVLDKATGATISTVGTATFWAPTGASLNSLTDPRTYYDPYNDRWIAVMQTFGSNSDILVGVSQTDDPNGTWFLYRFNTGASIDFPTVGFNKKWIVVSINRYSMGGTFQRGITLVVDYPQARAGTGTGTIFTQGANSHFCSAPCVTYSSTADTEYVVTHLSSGAATYAVDMITGTAGSPVYTAAGSSQTRPGGGWAQAGGNSLPQSGPNAGSSVCGATPCPIEAQDAQIRSAPVFRGGSIWYTQTVGLPASGLTHTGVQWTRLTTPSGAFVDGGRLEDATATSTNGGEWYAYPHIAPNAAGDFMVGFSQFSSAQHPGAGYAMHLAGDAAGTLRDPFIYHAGEDYYHKTFSTATGRNRWGDFSKVQVDPDDVTLWTVQEYAKTRVGTDDGNSGSNSSRWSTWWTAVGPPSLPSVALGSGPSTNEGNTGTTLFRFPVTLSAVSAQPVTVQYQTSDGTATVADNDYQAATSSIIIPAGNTSDTLFVNVVGDTRNEANETFHVTLTGATNAVLGLPVTATGTIVNDDPLPTLAISDVSLPEGNSGTTTFGFAVSLSAVSGQNVQVSYQTVDVTAGADTDYVATSGTATITAGALSAPIPVLVNGDIVPEYDETFLVRLSGPVNATFADSEGVGTILNDDAVSGVAPASITRFSLSRVIPNPSAGAPVRLQWGLPREAEIRVTVLDVRGRQVALLANGVQSAGWHSVAWNSRSPGFYFVRMQAPGTDMVERFALTR